MIKYKFLKYEIHSIDYLSKLSDVYELVIDRHLYSYDDIYVVCYHPSASNDERIIFRCNNKFELKIWMDLNGFEFHSCKIFYNVDKNIEYASIMLRKTRDEI